jgi:hypothetical protein
MRKRTYVTAAMLGLAAAALAAVVGAAGAGTSRTLINAGVFYKAQPCSGASSRLAAPKPVTAGTLELSRGGRTARVSLLEGGTRPASVSLSGSGPVKATLVLQTPRVKVTGAGGGAVERIPLGSRPAVGGRLFFSVGNDEERNGHVNTLIQLQRAARVAAITAPRQLPVITARVHDGPVGSRPQIGFDPPSTIEVGQANGHDAQWEPTPLVHEYGHFVLYTIARDGPDAGAHDASRSYPTKPNLAWSEGFPNAFAAVVLKEGAGLLYLGCGPYMNLASQPPRPTLASKVDERYAQYNETRVGAVTYQMIQRRLGGGQAGLKRLLTALPRYNRAGHSVWTARDLRDLAAQQFEHSGADDAFYNTLFFAEGMSWEGQIGVGPTTEPDPEFYRMRYAWATISLRLTGPGGFDCRTTTDIAATEFTRFDGAGAALGLKKASGGLSFAGSDDCYLISSAGSVNWSKPRQIGGERVTIPFPYLSGGRHWSGEYTVYAKFHCEFDPTNPPGIPAYCPTAIKARIYPVNKILLISTPVMAPGAPMTLSREVETKVATFKANGECHIGAVDCGV